MLISGFPLARKKIPFMKIIIIHFGKLIFHGIIAVISTVFQGLLFQGSFILVLFSVLHPNIGLFLEADIHSFWIFNSWSLLGFDRFCFLLTSFFTDCFKYFLQFCFMLAPIQVPFLEQNSPHKLLLFLAKFTLCAFLSSIFALDVGFLELI